MPALVLHARHDRMIDFEHGRRLASSIPGAHLVTLESDNHIVLGDEPAWQVIVEEISAVLEPERRAGRGRLVTDALSPHEREVLQLAASGHANPAIAERLVMSVRTVERHLQNV
jgi:DNA-binding NarL/FixJ family response regulator